MDADNRPTAHPAAAPSPVNAHGGTVEPANRASVARARLQALGDLPGERYELRDPFAEVTYRAYSLPEMTAQAERLGSSRFTAIDAQGRRTTVNKVDGTWQRGPQRPPQPERPAMMDQDRDEPGPSRGSAPEPAKPTTPSPQPAPREPGTQGPASFPKQDSQAERAAQVAQLEAALAERYLIKRAPVTVGDVTIGRTEYRFRGDTSRVAFTESTFRLATDTNSPSVARSMVDVAQARNWRALRVSGNEDFRRMVWLEASVRGVKTLGYEPNHGDLEVLRKERDARLVNRIEPAPSDGPASRSDTSKSHTVQAPLTPQTTPNPPPALTEKNSARGGGRKAVLAAIEAVLIAKQVPQKQREAVMAAAGEKLAQRVRGGQMSSLPKVKVYDKAAPSQRPVVAPTPEVQRSRERAAPAR
jgi:hypothetical protein